MNLKSAYGWDNEFGFHQARIEKFAINERLISNADYLKFVQDGGYQTKGYWSDEGWQWV
jgi:formylglycine-generating enzyme required for sulfatase activity